VPATATATAVPATATPVPATPTTSSQSGLLSQSQGGSNVGSSSAQTPVANSGNS
jgi:hypothetical protein